MRDLSIEGKITIFKILAILKIVHLGLITSVPVFITESLNITIKKNFWYLKKYKTKHFTLRNSYELGGLKDIDIFYKMINLQFS